MKLTKIIGLLSLICFTFFYTEKVINVAMDQDEIMIEIKEKANIYLEEPINAIINEDTIIPGKSGTYVNTVNSYKAMKKIGYYEPSLLVFDNIYPEISIYNNYDKYIISGNPYHNNISLLYIINNNNTIDNIINITKQYNIKINFFIDSTFLNNNISIIDKLNNNPIYNYGNNGTYTKDNIIITNNIINNKSQNKSIYCLFIKKDNDSLYNCKDNKMLSLIPTSSSSYLNIKTNLRNGNIYLIENTKELPTIINYITSKGYHIVPLTELINE